jgi:hypothetical protein
MKNPIKSLFTVLVLFLVALGGVHFLIANYVLPQVYAQFQILYIYLFLGGLSLGGMAAIFVIQKNDEELIGKGFLAFTILKMVGALLFLVPWLTDQDEFTRPFVYQFFAVFFPVLFVETFLILRLLKINEAQKAQKEKIN